MKDYMNPPDIKFYLYHIINVEYELSHVGEVVTVQHLEEHR